MRKTIRFIALFFLLMLLMWPLYLNLACTEGAFKVDVQPTQIPAEAVKLVVEPGAVQIAASAPAMDFPERMVNFELAPGSITLKVDAPVQQDFNIPKLGVAGVVLAAVILLFMKPPHTWGKGSNDEQSI